MPQEVYQDLEPDLYDWLFHKGLDGNWAAIPRDKVHCYFNNYNCPGVIRSPQFNTVRELAEKVTQDPEFLKTIS